MKNTKKENKLKTTFICKICSKKFEVSNCWLKREKAQRKGYYCSRNCFYVSRRINIKKRERKCINCSKLFIPRPYQLKKGHGKFCSHKCLGVVFSGTGNPMYGKTISKESIERANEKRKKYGYVGNKHPSFKTGTSICNGYVVITSPVFIGGLYSKRYHRYIYEKYYHVSLTTKDIIHHIDGDKKNNNIDNLMLMTRSQHINHHRNDLINGRKK